MMNLRWKTGELELNLDEFFPAKNKKCIDLNNILKECEDEKQKRKEIIQYLLEKMKTFEHNKIYVQGWNVKVNKDNLKKLHEESKNHKKKYKIQKLSEDYKKWILYLQNAITLGLKDNRGLINWEKVLED